MNKKITKDLLVFAFYRALWTFLEAILGCLTVGVAIWDFDWIHILSIAATTFVISFIKSMLVGVPEAQNDGFIIIDDSMEDRTRWLFQFKDGTDVDEITSKKNLTFTVQKEEKK